MCNFSIVIPCYRSAAWLPELVARIVRVMSDQGDSYEILLVHDASGDATWRVIRDLAGQYPAVRGLDLMFNTGQYRATLCGMQHARGRWIVTMDDDLQHRPEDLPKLIHALRDNPDLDCVMGRFGEKRHSRFRQLASNLVAWLYTHLYGKPKHLSQSSFRILTRDLSEAVCSHGTAFPAIGPLIYRCTQRIANVDVTHCSRPDGGSGYTLAGLVRIVLDNFFNASTLPLRLVSGLGVLAAVGSFALAAYYLIRYSVGGFSVPGFATVVLLNLFFGGMILFSVGLLGEYLSRMMEEIRRPPRYAIRERTGGAARSPGEANDTDDPHAA
jgi:glycosyltransferase involved in cell wall biosynthesis